MVEAVISGRPVPPSAACTAVGGALEDALAPACAVEFVHAYSLIHDDLPAMDDDDERRGRATVHVAFDEATAILAGDALQALAFEVLAHADEQWSLGPLTLPHMLVRLVLAEQLYRAAALLANHPYHRA